MVAQHGAHEGRGAAGSELLSRHPGRWWHRRLNSMAEMPAMLDKTLAEVRARIQKYRGRRRINEENTKATLIEPVLRALGWDVEDLDEVAREYKFRRRDKPVDYALLELRQPRLLIEAKALNEDLDDPRWISQVIGYAAVAGVEWAVLTNGDEYRLYNAHAPVHVDEKLFRKVRVSEPDSEVSDTLQLISKQRLAENRLQALWRAHCVDGRVRVALEDLFTSESSASLARLVAKGTSDLTKKEILDSIARCQVDFSFPVPVEPPKPGVKRKGKKASKKTVPGPKPRGGSSTSLRDLIEAGLLRPRTTLTRRYKGTDLTATVNADGTVTFGSETFNSPSMAGGAARASVVGRKPNGKLPATNGWGFWRVMTPEGEVKLDAIRAKLGGGPARMRLVEGE
jgi:Restriction Enzyme Adenine Methylase Associated